MKKRINSAIELLEGRTLLSALAWSPGIALPVARGGGAAVNSPWGIILLAGREPSGAASSVYELPPDATEWTKGQSIEPSRLNAGVGETGGYYSSAKYNSDIFLFGGTNAGKPLATTLNYDPRADGDVADGPLMITARASLAYASDAASGGIYAIGGLGTGNTVLSSVERYDATADAWSPVASLPQSLYAASAAGDGLGHLFVAGGSHTLGGAPSSSVYRYTIATNSWDQVSSLNLAVRDAGVAAAPDGMIYVIGGISASGTVASVQVYNPATDVWSNEMSLPAAVSDPAVAVDANNLLNVIGGFNSSGAPVNTVSTTPIIPGVLAPYTPTINFADNWYSYDGLPHGVTASVLGIDGVTPVDGNVTFTYDGSPNLPTQAGNYKVIGTFESADSNYRSTVAAGDLYIAQALPNLQLSGGGTITYDGQPHPVTASVTGVDHVSPVNGTLAITYNGSTSAPVNGGTYNVLATFTSADLNYADVTATTTITIPDPTIPTGLKSTGVSTTEIRLSWDPALVPVAGYNLYTRHVLHDPKGSGSTITYPLVAGNIQGTSVLLNVGAGSVGKLYYISSISPEGVVSPRSAPVSGVPLYAPSMYGALLGGAVVSSVNVQAGQPVQLTLLAYGNEYPTFSKVSGPDTMSVDPVSGLITYSPTLAEAGDVIATFQGTNSVGSATQTLYFHVVPPPSVAGISVDLPGAAASALNTAGDGGTLLPAGRNTTLPWAGLNHFSLTLSSAAALTAGDISVKGSSGIDYGPVILAGSGSNYQFTLATPINTADRVTISIGNTGLTSFVRRINVLPGDINDDGQVNFGDLVPLAQNFSKPGALAQGDLTGDGRVDFDDLVLVAQRYGTSLPPDLPAFAPTSLGTGRHLRSIFSGTRVK